MGDNQGLLSKPLADIEAQLRGAPITQEFHAFCYLCPSDSPVASALASLLIMVLRMAGRAGDDILET